MCVCCCFLGIVSIFLWDFFPLAGGLGWSSGTAVRRDSPLFANLVARVAGPSGGGGVSVQFHGTSPTKSNDFVLPIPEELLIHTSENASGLSHVASSLEKPAQCTLNSTLSPTVFRATVPNLISDWENRAFAAMCIDLFRFHLVFGRKKSFDFVGDVPWN